MIGVFFKGETVTLYWIKQNGRLIYTGFQKKKKCNISLILLFLSDSSGRLCFSLATFVTVPFIFLILGVPKILKWLDDCNHVKINFLEVCFVKLLLKC